MVIIRTLINVINDLAKSGTLFYTQRVGGSNPSSPTTYLLKSDT